VGQCNVCRRLRGFFLNFFGIFCLVVLQQHTFLTKLQVIKQFVIYGCVLDAEKECKTNPAGNGYDGTKSVSAIGKTCIRWTKVENYDITTKLPVDDVTKAKNYCRKLADTDRDHPSCVVLIDSKSQTEEMCKIDFCGESYNNKSSK